MQRRQGRTALPALVALAPAGCADPMARGTDPVDEVTAPDSSAAPEPPPCPATGGDVSAGPVDAARRARAVTLVLVQLGVGPLHRRGLSAVVLWRNTVEVGLENTPGSSVAVTPAPGELDTGGMTADARRLPGPYPWSRDRDVPPTWRNW